MHGFRSTFATWAEECTDYPDGVREAALAHKYKSETTAAYQRGHKLEKRRGLMKDWARSLWSLSYRNRSRPQHHQQNTEAKSTFWPLLKQWVRFWQGRKCFIFQRGVD